MPEIPVLREKIYKMLEDFYSKHKVGLDLSYNGEIWDDMRFSPELKYNPEIEQGIEEIKTNIEKLTQGEQFKIKAQHIVYMPSYEIELMNIFVDVFPN